MHLQLKRGALAISLDKGLRHDPVLWRHLTLVSDALERFRPDLIHITSPGDVGEMGVALAYKLDLPLVISWHTNFHEFGALRLERILHWLPHTLRKSIGAITEHHILNVMVRFYRLGRVLFAPNGELVEMLSNKTRRPVFLMRRGIDTQLFSPARRTVHDGVFRIGYVGRLTPEKSVRFLVEIERALVSRGLQNFRFLIVGDGSERTWLGQHLEAADFTGVLRGDELSEAYANMDIFAFPSRTDTFGNVVLESLASGTPCVVTDQGGPKFIIEEGVTGFSAGSAEDFISRVVYLFENPSVHAKMRIAARTQACEASWDKVFEGVYTGYQYALEHPFPARATYLED